MIFLSNEVTFGRFTVLQDVKFAALNEREYFWKF